MIGMTAGVPPAPQGAEDPAERLRRLEELERQGLITAEEHEAQRVRILGEL
jgi:hypothetical protein